VTLTPARLTIKKKPSQQYIPHVPLELLSIHVYNKNNGILVNVLEKVKFNQIIIYEKFKKSKKYRYEAVKHKEQ